MALVRIERKPPPPPGMYEKLPMSDYLGWDAVSKSVLERMKTSPAHAQACETWSSSDTPATLLGTAIHSAILEPELFEGIYGRLPGDDLRKSDAKAAKAAFIEAGRIPLKPVDWEVCDALRDRAWAKSTVRDLLEQATGIEVSGLFPTRHEGIYGKLRPDILCADARTVVDLKSARDASKHGFERAMGEHAYHLSPGWYLPGLRTLGVECDHWVWVALEKTPPYGVALYSLEAHEIARATQECEDLVAAYARCADAKLWPDYPDIILPIVIPKWAK